MITSSEIKVNPTANVGMDDQATRAGAMPSRGTSGRQKKSRGGQTCDEGPPPIYTVEPVNVDMLRNVASRREAETFRLQGCTASLLECIYYFLRCVEKEYGCGVGSIVVCWRESSTIDVFGIVTR